MALSQRSETSSLSREPHQPQSNAPSVIMQTSTPQERALNRATTEGEAMQVEDGISIAISELGDKIYSINNPTYKNKGSPVARQHSQVHSHGNMALPSFAESQFQTIQRRQVQPIHAAGDGLFKYSSSPSRFPNLSNAWEFEGWGSTYYMELPPSDLDVSRSVGHTAQLGQFRATSIAGNDLIASVLYTVGVTIVLAGKHAPISLLIVTMVIYPFKDIISEIGTALPLNGGTYNCMLNTTSKTIAAFAATLSILSYMATVVVSAASATAYLAGEVTLPSLLPVFWLTIIVMIVFAGIALLGLRESANVSLAIFVFHCCTLLVLMVVSAIQWGTAGSAILSANWSDTDYSSTSPSVVALQIFNGFCVGLLGITGFETAENYIEDLKPGVFPKVMRNMWGMAFFYNAPIALLATAVVPINVLVTNPNNVLSMMGEYAGGRWLRWLVVIDAVIVLCAGILTGLIGVSGLLERMATDQLLPAFLLYRNRWTGAPQYIIISFLVFCITLYSIVDGDITSLSGVFAIAFVSDMCMFSISNLLLKYKRGRLPAVVHVSSGTAIFGLLCLLAGVIGNFVINPNLARYFFTYFTIVFTIMLLMLNRIWLLKTLFFFFDQVTILHQFPFVERAFIRSIRALKKQPVVFFTKTDEIHHLNKAVLYVRANESAGSIKFVHIYDKIEDIPERLEANHRVLDEIYPKIQIDLVFIQGKFDPPTIDIISRMLNVPKGLMFITCPGPNFPYGIGAYHGLRTIML